MLHHFYIESIVKVTPYSAVAGWVILQSLAPKTCPVEANLRSILSKFHIGGRGVNIIQYSMRLP